ncbi:MAG: hypothetical protein LBQ73_03760, partial [Tannerellaceae bacterium]|nr:hypothetical protein [Tannerellaceae bacterium]
MKRGSLLLLFLFAAFCVEAQPEMTLILNKEGKMMMIPKRKTYELNIPPYSYKSYTPASSPMRIGMDLQEFTPYHSTILDERPMDMQVLSEAYRPFFNVYTPMLRRVSPLALDFREASVVSLGDDLSLLTIGEQATWPLLGGTTAINSNVVWRYDRWTLSGGGFAGRYYTPANLSPGFMGGVNTQARYEASSRLSFRAWAQYAAYSDSKSANPYLMTNPYMNHTGMGGAMEFMFTENIGAGMGVSYEYNP